MKQGIFTIESNAALTDSVYRMVLSGDTSAITAPGQFVNIQLSGKFLRRPISVCDYDEKTLTIVYKVVGKGTAQMAAMQAGETLDILTGLGNGYDLSLTGEAPVLLGGGVGVPPMYNLAKKLLAQGKKVTVILGFNTKSEIFYEQEFKDLGCTVTVTTVDGSYGKKGFVTEAEDLAPYVTERTIALILNSPNNPNGCIWNREQLTDIAKLAVEKGFYVVSDEIYEKLIADCALTPERTLFIDDTLPNVEGAMKLGINGFHMHEKGMMDRFFL